MKTFLLSVFAVLFAGAAWTAQATRSSAFSLDTRRTAAAVAATSGTVNARTIDVAWSDLAVIDTIHPRGSIILIR